MIDMIDTVVNKIAKATYTGNTEDIQLILKDWGNSIVDHCRDNWECSLEQRDVENEVECYTLENGDQVYPVLSRSSIECTKELIK